MGSNTGFGLAFTLLASLATLYYFRRTFIHFPNQLTRQARPYVDPYEPRSNTRTHTRLRFGGEGDSTARNIPPNSNSPSNR